MNDSDHLAGVFEGQLCGGEGCADWRTVCDRGTLPEYAIRFNCDRVLFAMCRDLSYNTWLSIVGFQ